MPPYGSESSFVRGKTRSMASIAHGSGPLIVIVLAVAAAAVVLSGDASAISLQPNTIPGDADIIFSGGPSDLLPSALAAGRWNGDAYDDLLACSWDNNTCWVFYGGMPRDWRTASPDIVIVGPSGGFGGSATFLGDINDDGFQDFGIGAPFTPGAGTSTQGGSLWIFFGRGGTSTGSIGYYDADLIVFSTQNFARLGWSASAAGDMNGDGIDDFWVSAPNLGTSGGNQGSLYLFLGKRQFPDAINETSAALVIEGVAPPDGGGHVLLGGKDLNRDGRPDLVVSSAQYEDASGAVAGAAHVFLGPLPRAKAVLSTDDADVHIWGTASIPSMGSALAFSQNFMVGGAPTLIVSADLGNSSAGQGGAVYLFNSSQFACCQVLWPWDADGLLYSPDEGGHAGASIAVGDIDGDGFDDLAVGAPEAQTAYDVALGRVFLFYGNTTTRSPRVMENATGWINGPRVGADFGSVVLLMNLNGDGKADILIGAPGARELYSNSGAAYAFYGRVRNRVPAVTIDVVVDVEEGQEFQAWANISDADDDRLSWRWSLGAASGPNSYDNVDLVTLVFRDDGEFSIALTVFDGEFYNSTEVRIHVRNAPPVCELNATSRFVEGQMGGLRVNMSDPGNDEISYQWVGPEALTIDERVASYTPPNGQPFNVSVQLTDDDGGTGACNLTVPVENVPPTVRITAPGVVYEGDYVQLGSTVTDPGEPEEIRLEWQTPVGPLAGPSVEWWTDRPGFFAVELWAYDQDGGYSSATAVVQVIGRPPAVALVIPTGVYEGDPVNITVEQVAGRDYDELVYTWSVNGYTTQFEGGSRYSITHAQPGRAAVYVHVTDDDGDVVELEGWLNVANRAPLSGLRVSPQPPFTENMEISFQPKLYTWETTPLDKLRFNWSVDGQVVSWGNHFSVFLGSGDHRVAVEATDEQGGVSRYSVRVVIENVPPLVFMDGPDRVQPGSLNTWTASASDPSGGAVTVRWEVDGEPSSEGTSLEWMSRSPGPHVIRVYAQDEGGAITSATMTVEVLGPPTVEAPIDFSWIGVTVGASAAFAAGIVLGAYVLDRVRNRRRNVDEIWKP